METNRRLGVRDGLAYGQEAQHSNELLVTFIGTSGEEECAVVRIADTYEETLSEACTSLAPWLPNDWPTRRRDFAREIRNRKGDMIWAAVQPALVLELGRLGRLPELRLRVHPPTDEGPGAHLNNQHNDVQIPAYEEVQQPSAVDGIVQAVLHRLQNQNENNNAGNPPRTNAETMSAEDEKKRLEQLLDSTAPAPPPLPPRIPQPLPPLARPVPPPPALPPNIPLEEPRPLPVPAVGRVPYAENNQLPTPQSPLNHPIPWAHRPQPQPSPRPQPTPQPQPEIPVAPENTRPVQRNSKPPPAKEDDPNTKSVSLANVLQASIKSVTDGQYEGALKALRSALNDTNVPGQRAKLYLWLAQIGCEIKEYHNASADATVARDLFMSLGDHSGRLDCGLLSARIDRVRNGTATNAKLAQLLEDARRRQIKRIEISILCELCELACATRNTTEMTQNLERAKAIAQSSGDMWYKAGPSRVSGMVSEANGDFVTALQSYSGALELYQGANPRSPILPIKDLQESIERMRVKLSGSMNKQSRGRFKFF